MQVTLGPEASEFHRGILVQRLCDSKGGKTQQHVDNRTQCTIHQTVKGLAFSRTLPTLTLELEQTGRCLIEYESNCTASLETEKLSQH